MAETTEAPAPPAPGEILKAAGAEASRYGRTGDMIKAKMPQLVKGAGYATGNEPLRDPAQITMKAAQATVDLRQATWQGYNDRSSVVKGLSPDFLSQFGMLRTALSMPSLGEQLAGILGSVASPDLVRSFTAGNLGIGSVYGLAPFDLLAP